MSEIPDTKKEPTYKKELKGTLGLKGSLSATKIHQYYIRHWYIIALQWVLTTASISLTSFIIRGWASFIIGIIVSAVLFFLGIWGTIKVIERDIYHNL
jgi:hypothetical protein